MLEHLAIVGKVRAAMREAIDAASAGNLKETSPIEASMRTIENTSLESLKARNAENLKVLNEALTSETGRRDHHEADENGIAEVKKLSEDERATMKSETGWSDEIMDAIRSMEEYGIYKEAGLREVEVDGRKCLIRDDIDWGERDDMGRTNRQRVEEGLAPIKDGKPIELHHIGQKEDGPLAELTRDEHRSPGNWSILHNRESGRGIDPEWGKEREAHWKSRLEENQNAR